MSMDLVIGRVMTFDEIDNAIDGHQRDAGSASGGNVNDLVYSALDVHAILNIIQGNVDELRETYAKPVEMTREQKCNLIASKNSGESFYHMMSYLNWEFAENVFGNILEEDLMRAWLNTDVIKVVE